MNRRLEIPASKQSLEIKERPIPEAPAGGAVVKMHFAGICHTDVHLLEDEKDMGGGKVVPWSAYPTISFPMVMGHEMAGEIYEFGPGVDSAALGLSVGDLVMVYPWGGCGQCKYCRDEHYNCCPKWLDRSLGISLPGGFEEYVPVPEVSFLIPVPDGLPMDVASMLPCSGITTYNAVTTVIPSVEEYLSVHGKASLLIVGAGGLGLWGIQEARQLMPKGTEIIVAEAFESKFADARNAGADKTVLWPINATVDDNVAALKKLAPDGVAGAVDFVGAPQTTSSIFGCLAPNTTMVGVGLFGGQMSLPTPDLVCSQKVVLGRLVGDPEHLRQMAKLVADGKVKPPPITHVRLEDTGRVLAELKAGTSRGRNIVKLLK